MEGKKNQSKSIKINSGRSIYNLAQTITAHAALPLSGLFIARLSLFFLDLRGLSPARQAKA